MKKIKNFAIISFVIYLCFTALFIKSVISFVPDNDRELTLPTENKVLLEEGEHTVCVLDINGSADEKRENFYNSQLVIKDQNGVVINYSKPIENIRYTINEIESLAVYDFELKNESEVTFLTNDFDGTIYINSEDLFLGTMLVVISFLLSGMFFILSIVLTIVYIVLKINHNKIINKA